MSLKGNDSVGIGKCSHGGKDDAFSDVNAIGGINKETSDSSLSPHFFLHHTAGEAAIQATNQFFVGEGNLTPFVYIRFFFIHLCSIMDHMALPKDVSRGHKMLYLNRAIRMV